MDQEQQYQLLLSSSVRDLTHEVFNETAISLIGPGRAIPTVVYWRSANENDDTLRQAIDRHAYSRLDFLIMTLPCNPKILAAVVNGAYVPPGKLNYDRLCSQFALPIDPALVEAYNNLHE
jgi:hypothetical protein